MNRYEPVADYLSLDALSLLNAAQSLAHSCGSFTVGSCCILTAYVGEGPGSCPGCMHRTTNGCMHNIEEVVLSKHVVDCIFKAIDAKGRTVSSVLISDMLIEILSNTDTIIS